MYIVLGIVGITGLVFGMWRLASRRRSLPCPVWLRWMVELDNPFTKTNRAAEIISHLELQPGMTVLDAGAVRGASPFPWPKWSARRAVWSLWTFRRACLTVSGKKRQPSVWKTLISFRPASAGGNSGVSALTAPCW